MQKQCFQQLLCAWFFFRFLFYREVFETIFETHVCPDCNANTTSTTRLSNACVRRRMWGCTAELYLEFDQTSRLMNNAFFRKLIHLSINGAITLRASFPLDDRKIKTKAKEETPSYYRSMVSRVEDSLELLFDTSVCMIYFLLNFFLVYKIRNLRYLSTVTCRFCRSSKDRSVEWKISRVDNYFVDTSSCKTFNIYI